MLLAIGVMVLSPSPGFASDTKAPPEQPLKVTVVDNPQVLSSATLAEGVTFRKFDRVAVSGDARDQVVIINSEAEDGSHGSTEAGLTPFVDPATDQEVEAAAAAYAAAGRSPQQDALALGLDAEQAARVGITYAPETVAALKAGASPQQLAADTPPALQQSQGGRVYASGCAEIRNRAYWYGCYARTSVRENDPSYRYSAEESQGAGHGDFWWAITQGRTDHRYSANGQLFRWRPLTTMPGSNCNNAQIGMTVGNPVTSISLTFPVCNDRVAINVSPHRFFSQWEGHMHGPWVGSAAISSAKVRNGRTTGFQFWVANRWEL